MFLECLAHYNYLFFHFVKFFLCSDCHCGKIFPGVCHVNQSLTYFRFWSSISSNLVSNFYYYAFCVAEGKLFLSSNSINVLLFSIAIWLSMPTMSSTHKRLLIMISGPYVV